MFDLRNIFELVDNGLGNRPFTQQEFVHQRHQSILHVRTDPCVELLFKPFATPFGRGITLSGRCITLVNHMNRVTTQDRYRVEAMLLPFNDQADSG
jgi:hypothetical protein